MNYRYRIIVEGYKEGYGWKCRTEAFVSFDRPVQADSVPLAASDIGLCAIIRIVKFEEIAG